MKKFIISILLIISIGIVFIPKIEADENVEIVRGKVVEKKKWKDDLGFEIESLKIKILQGEHKSKLVEIERVITGHPVYDTVLNKSDEVLLRVESKGDRITCINLQEYARDKHLRYLVATFFILLIIIGGMRGFKASISLIITALAVVRIFLPFILKGYNPIHLAVITAASITIVTLTIIGGITKKTIAAIIGTIGGVYIAGMIAINIGSAARLSGFGENAHFLLEITGTLNINFQGILFAGMIIGSLGAIMDVGMSVASAVEEVKRANPGFGLISLTRAGMNVGRDIMGTMANTLILAYTGSAIPLLLVFMAVETPLIQIVNLDFISTEIVRALSSSIGLILATPLTAVFASLLLSFGK